ncbi:myelin-oligodendrocyte glycoprotein [Xenopus laevis]|uniref:Myelin-oligodendrocyte glycoprotein n=2 Tax=Xenopus laevis TaxID=8355 RepID=A0A1L8G0A5_XENLA|nr:myelin-oligodendrocyte glycoprotein [Xenopus laevis]OCT77286.1 hypothetical protein XELAEV_18032485mg [Xenopus laevis]
MEVGGKFSFIVAFLPLLLLLGTRGEFLCPDAKRVVNVLSIAGGLAQLPCTFFWQGEEPEDMKVIWQKKREGEVDLVVHFQNGDDEEDEQSEEFHGRTSVLQDWFKKSDATLTLDNLLDNDSGLYNCHVSWLPMGPQTQQMCCTVALTVNPEQKSLWERYQISIILGAFLAVAVTMCLSPGHQMNSEKRIIFITTVIILMVATLLVFMGELYK